MDGSNSRDGWLEFDRQVLWGVPHAVDIAHHLTCTPLTYPLEGEQNPDSDILFYCVLHTAYRKGVLRRFLLLMERLRGHRLWSSIRECKLVQRVLIENFMVQWHCDDDECYELLASWLEVQSESSEACGHADLLNSQEARRAA